MTRIALVVALAAAGAGTAGAVVRAPGGSPWSRTTAGMRLVEQTPDGLTLTLVLGAKARTGRLAVTCADGSKLGASPRFSIRHNRFRAAKGATFAFRGTLAKKARQFHGSGTARCGASAVGFTQPSLGVARMTSCPASSPDAPLTPDTPYPFAGVLPGAAQGTVVRLEYTNPDSPDGSPVVVHVVTDASGAFADQHAFPPEDHVYGADAIPRFPDDPLSPGDGCDVQVQ